jgi:large subunit ribosomal protein L4e
LNQNREIDVLTLSKTIDVYDLNGVPKGKINLPEIFTTKFRPDIIKKSVVALQTHKLQPQGRDLMAGKRTTAHSFGVGRALARVPRVRGERHPQAGSAAFAPNTVGGRMTHPPTTKKNIHKRLNKKEACSALASAVAATAKKEIVSSRGHKLEQVPSIPLIVTDNLESVSETKKAMDVLKTLGLWQDVERVMNSIKKRSGRASSRGRGKRIAKGPLLVCNDDKGIAYGFKNIPGIDAVKASDLNVEDLAPGTHAGRLTVWTESAMKTINDRLKGD